ncbi:hypothetical protein ACFCY8_11400 [Streptomyces noursei]|uniref:hypothetical protein n=1 Tax=Streptomyces noursei TaxID=1971 RepID=UPI0035DC76AF
MEYPEELAYMAELEGPPALADESVPALDGWSVAEANLGDLMDAATDSLEPWSTEDRAGMLSRALLQGGVRHILHYDGPEQSLTLRLDKYGATTLAALVEEAAAARSQAAGRRGPG